MEKNNQATQAAIRGWFSAGTAGWGLGLSGSSLAAVGRSRLQPQAPPAPPLLFVRQTKQQSCQGHGHLQLLFGTSQAKRGAQLSAHAQPNQRTKAVELSLDLGEKQLSQAEDASAPAAV